MPYLLHYRGSSSARDDIVPDAVGSLGNLQNVLMGDSIRSLTEECWNWRGSRSARQSEGYIVHWRLDLVTPTGGQSCMSSIAGRNTFEICLPDCAYSDPDLSIYLAVDYARRERK